MIVLNNLDLFLIIILKAILKLVLYLCSSQDVVSISQWPVDTGGLVFIILYYEANRSICGQRPPQIIVAKGHGYMLR